MDAEKQNMIDKIMKLLELGKDDNGAFGPEQEQANNMAAKLMAKHSIGFHDLRSGKKGFDFIHQKVDPLDEVHRIWESRLANCIADAFDCKVVICKNGRGNGWYLSFMGTKTDLEITIFFYRHLRRTVGRKSELAFKSQRDQDGYAYGMVVTIGERLVDLYKRRQQVMDNECKGLVVVKGDGLKNFVNSIFPRLSSSKAKVPGSREAYTNGLRDGKTVGLSRPISGGSSPKTKSID